MKARLCTGSPEDTRVWKGPLSPRRRVVGLDPSTLHPQKLQWKTPESPTRQRSSHAPSSLWWWAGKGFVRGGPTAVVVLQPQVWERLATPETGFLKLVSVMSTLTKQKVLGRTLPHAWVTFRGNATPNFMKPVLPKFAMTSAEVLHSHLPLTQMLLFCWVMLPSFPFTANLLLFLTLLQFKFSSPPFKSSATLLCFLLASYTPWFLSLQ